MDTKTFERKLHTARTQEDMDEIFDIIEDHERWRDLFNKIDTIGEKLDASTEAYRAATQRLRRPWWKCWDR